VNVTFKRVVCKPQTGRKEATFTSKTRFFQIEKIYQFRKNTYPPT